ncbi:MAG: hypothetical protein J3R72DRAFT_491132 [Linnemannia gamsii]|nr:MAG: hypothetical protein J3R72DRAFT_491132 [Linnemannia gamsii]
MVSIPTDHSSAFAQRGTVDDYFRVIFPYNVAPPVLTASFPLPGARIDSTLQLVYCNSILARKQEVVSAISDDPGHFNTLLEDREQAWRQGIETLEPYRLRWTVEQMVKSFAEDTLKGSAAVTEIVLLGPLLDRENYRILISCLLDKFEQPSSMDLTLLRGLVQVLECAPSGFLIGEDLVRITSVLFKEISTANNLANDHLVYLTWALSRNLDVMVAGNVKDLNRDCDHQPTLQLLANLKNGVNIYVRHQAAHAFQALLYACDDETPLQLLWRLSQSSAVGTSDGSSVFMLNPLQAVKGLQRLQDIQGGAYEDTTSGIKGSRVAAVIEQDATTFTNDADQSKGKCPWYLALQGTALFVRQGRLNDFNQVVIKAPCRHDVNFQWGVCRQLGEIAVDHLWDAEIRQQAIDFLVRLYRTNTDWSPQSDTKSWILSLLCFISSQADPSTMDHALASLKDLKSYTANEFPRAIPLDTRLPLPASFPLLSRVQKIPEIELTLHALMKKTIAEHEQILYIPPMAKASLNASDNDYLFSLMDKAQEFLASDRQVMLILGDSGAGKSTFNRHLENVLWKKYDRDRIPLFINLPESKQPDKDLVAEQLRAYNFSEVQIQELKYHRQFILICDGYDERQLNCNLHTTNSLNHPDQWSTKLIITCRTQYLGSEYRDRFVPDTPGIFNRSANDLFQEAVIVPFSTDQIADFIGYYIPLEPRTWSTQDYMDKLTTIPNLMDMAKNPFLLSITLEALPKLVDGKSDLSKVRILRAQLYDVFVNNWLQINKRRLQGSTMSTVSRLVLDELLERGFTRMGLDYSTRLAAAIFQMQDGNPVVHDIQLKKKVTSKQEFFGPDYHALLLLESIPLIRTEKHFRFIHRSVLEYFFSRTIFDPDNHNERTYFQLKDVFNATYARLVDERLAVANSPLYWKSLTSEPSVIQFLCDRVQQFPASKQQLLAIIWMSKTNSEATHAAANAITILARAGVRLNGVDFSGARIPGADLSGAELDSVRFHGADLTGVNFSRSWIRQVDFTDALMSGVQFGERSVSCSFSSDGQVLSMGMSDGAVKLWDASTFHLSKAPRNQPSLVSDIVFSPSYQRIASASEDFSIQLWDAEAGHRLQDLKGHNNRITSIAFSPDGRQLVTCSLDRTIRLWDLKTGAFEKIFLGHKGDISDISFSWDGRWIALASSDATGRTWDAQNHCGSAVLRGHVAGVTAIVFSPCGRKIATGSLDKTVRTWNARTGDLQNTIVGHDRPVTALVYSSDDSWIASGGSDGLVRLWRSEDGLPGRVFPGHTLDITTLVFSPSNDLLVSSSLDTTVRWWNIRSGESGVILRGSSIEMAGTMEASTDIGDRESENTVVQLWEGDAEGAGTGSRGHGSKVTSVTFSPRGRQVISGGNDRTLRSWDAQSSEPGQHFEGHERSVTAVACSLRGDLVSASLDHSLIMWNTNEGLPATVFRGHEASVTSVSFTPCSQRIVSGSADWTVRVWDVSSGTELGTFVGHTQAVRSVAVSPTGTHVASGSEDMTVRIWALHSAGSSRVLAGHTDSVSCVAYSINGKYIASASEDGTARVWDAASARFCFVMEGHTEALLCVAFSLNDQLIATGGFDNTLRLWRADSGECLDVIKDFFGAVRSVAWSPDGMSFATGSDDRSVRVWRVVAEDDGIKVQLQWSSGSDVVVASDARIQGAVGLSRVNRTLLLQRGAIGGDDNGYLVDIGHFANRTKHTSLSSNLNFRTQRSYTGPGSSLSINANKEQWQENMITTKPSHDRGTTNGTPSPRPSTLSPQTHDKEKRHSFFSKFSSSAGHVSTTDTGLARDTRSRTNSHANNAGNHGDNDGGSTGSGRRRKRDRLRDFLRRSERDTSTGQQRLSKPSLPDASANGGVHGQSAFHGIKETQAQCASFPHNGVQRLAEEVLPEFGSRIDKTSQLALCLSLLTHQSSQSQLSTIPDLPLQDSGPGEMQREWMQDLKKDIVEQDRIRWLGVKMVEEFLKDPSKNSTAIAEILLLGPVLDKEHYRKLLDCFIAKFNGSYIQDAALLQGLVELVQDARPGYLRADDLVATLAVLRCYLQKTHLQSPGQSPENLFHLTLAVSRILDVMADHKVQDLDRVTQEEPLSSVLSVLKDDSDPFLMYQASYAFQALQYVPNNETSLQAVVRYSTGLAESLIKISSLVKLDLENPLEGLKEIQAMMAEAVDVGKSAYEGTLSLMESGRGLLGSVRKGLGSGHKRPWYLAVRTADALVREGRLADLSSLIRDAPCRRDPFFQWGISQILAEIAVGSIWDSNIRQRSVNILDDLFRDSDWNRDPSVREWMRVLFDLIASETDLAIQEGSHRLLDGLKNDLDTGNSITYPLRARLPAPGSSLLARVQEIPPVEYKLHRFKVQRLKPRHHQVYVGPKAKASLQSRDKDLFSLEENVREFLRSKREVMLLLGDSGSGKSTFSRYLEQELWKQYKEGGPIPLFVTLPSITNPQRDMIDQQLKIYEFTEEQVRELRQSRREFILICDGYDESQKGVNLHSTNLLNQDGQWRAKMVISCRSQHVKTGYQDWFQPQGDRYKNLLTTAPDLFQEAVIAPFSRVQIKEYVEQYVKSDEDHFTSSRPLDWTTDDYMYRLAGIRDLMALVSNPFLLSLALVALPGLVSTKEELRNVRVSRVELYDIFADNWLICGLKRLRNSTMSEADRDAFEILESDFLPAAKEYLKELSTAIFKKQGGNPVVTFDERKDKDVWQCNFFGSNREIRLLRVSSPLIPSGKNKHRFLHRSLLEYFYSRTFSDPKDPEAETDVDDDEPPIRTFAQVRESIADHPLRLQSILDQPLVIQFLAERAQVDIFFKQQLLAMVESLDTDTQSVQAAVQAVEILTMARNRFNGFNLSGARVQRRS